MNGDDQIVLLEGIISRIDEIIEEMDNDQDLFYNSLDYAQQLRDMLQDTLESIL